MPSPKKIGPTVTVDPKHCKIHPLGKIHAPKKSRGGYVVFNALAPCTLLFTNPEVFGHDVTRHIQYKRSEHLVAAHPRRAEHMLRTYVAGRTSGLT